MLGKAAWIAVVLAGAVLAGCIGGKDDGKAATTDVNKTGVIDANETTAPVGTKIAAFNETNATETTGQGAMMHQHDYWHSKTRKVIWTQNIGLIPLPLTPCKTTDCTLGGSSETYPPGTAIADFDMPAYDPVTDTGGMVFEGTDHLEITAADVRVWPSGTGGSPHVAHPAIHVMFDYLAANDEPGKFRTGGELKPDTPFILPVKPTDADMPHSQKSLWVWRIYTGEANAFSFNLTVVAVKGNSIANWPPHPNLYADKTERVVLDAEQKFESKGTADYEMYGSMAGWQGPDKIISYGTDSIDVTVSNVQFASQLPTTPDHYVFEWHNASSAFLMGNGDPAGGRLEDKGSDGKTFRFSIKTEAMSYDTPYGQKSRWAFRLMPRFTDPTQCTEAATGGDPFIAEILVGCQFVPYTMSYHIKIVAHGHSTAMGISDPLAGSAGATPASPTPPTSSAPAGGADASSPILWKHAITVA